jgi:hypothetical protein
LYLVINSFYLTIFDSLNLQLLALYDFTINYKFDLNYSYFFKINKYIQTFQYYDNLLIKNITLINKNIELSLNNSTFLWTQFIIAVKELHIIIQNIFENFNVIKTNNFSTYMYLFFNSIELNIYNYYLVFNLYIYYFIVSVFQLCSVIIGCSKLYNYDLYIIFMAIYFFYFINYYKNIYHQNDYNCMEYTINRWHHFDDKYYYNNETINLKPEILYDIETLTFFNNSIDCYLYWF